MVGQLFKTDVPIDILVNFLQSCTDGTNTFGKDAYKKACISGSINIFLDSLKISYSYVYNLDEKDLIKEYQNSDIVSFISTYEGFGLPLLEAMNMDCPVICSDTSCFSEVTNNAAAMFDPNSNKPYPNTGIRGSLMIYWSFPINPQMDIKKFQVFRRKKINEPFELIKVFDFADGSVVFPDLEETINQSLIEKTLYPECSYYDDDFLKKSE